MRSVEQRASPRRDGPARAFVAGRLGHRRHHGQPERGVEQIPQRRIPGHGLADVLRLRSALLQPGDHLLAVQRHDAHRTLQRQQLTDLGVVEIPAAHDHRRHGEAVLEVVDPAQTGPAAGGRHLVQPVQQQDDPVRGQVFHGHPVAQPVFPGKDLQQPAGPAVLVVVRRVPPPHPAGAHRRERDEVDHHGNRLRLLGLRGRQQVIGQVEELRRLSRSRCAEQQQRPARVLPRGPHALRCRHLFGRHAQRVRRTHPFHGLLQADLDPAGRSMHQARVQRRPRPAQHPLPEPRRKPPALPHAVVGPVLPQGQLGRRRA